tara:strand:+ start:120 stop:314 length:195 start_codon:yes stop_codon:yes gene_type:complete
MSDTYLTRWIKMAEDEGLSPEIKQACILLGIAVMQDVRMVVREELARVGLKPPIFTKKEDENNG